MRYLLHNSFIDQELSKDFLKDAKKHIYSLTLLEKRTEIKDFSTIQKRLNSEMIGLKDITYTEIKAHYNYGCEDSIFEDIQEQDETESKHCLITNNDELALFFADKSIELFSRKGCDLLERFKYEIKSLTKKLKDGFQPETYKIGILSETLIELLLSNITLKKAAYDGFVKHRQTLKSESKAPKIEKKISESKLNLWLTDPKHIGKMLLTANEDDKPDKMEIAFLEYEEIDIIYDLIHNYGLSSKDSEKEFYTLKDPEELRDLIFQLLDDLIDAHDIETVCKNLLFRISYCQIKTMFHRCQADSSLFMNPECFIAELRRKLFLELHIPFQNVIDLNVPNSKDIPTFRPFYLIIN